MLLSLTRRGRWFKSSIAHNENAKFCRKKYSAKKGPEHEQELQTAVDAGGRRKPRNDRRFGNASHRAKWNYHRGIGKSNWKVKKKKRDRQRTNPNTG
jgi:hypothetical protein